MKIEIEDLCPFCNALILWEIYCPEGGEPGLLVFPCSCGALCHWAKGFGIRYATKIKRGPRIITRVEYPDEHAASCGCFKCAAKEK